MLPAAQDTSCKITTAVNGSWPFFFIFRYCKSGPRHSTALGLPFSSWAWPLSTSATMGVAAQRQEFISEYSQAFISSQACHLLLKSYFKLELEKYAAQPLKTRQRGQLSGHNRAAQGKNPDTAANISAAMWIQSLQLVSGGFSFVRWHGLLHSCMFQSLLHALLTSNDRGMSWAKKSSRKTEQRVNSTTSSKMQV